MHREYTSLREGYADLGRKILKHGDWTAPRGERTKEVLGASFTLRNPVDSLPVGTGRGVVKALAAVEALQLIGGFHDPEALTWAAPHYRAFLDPETGEQRSPYGPRTSWQIPYALDALRKDPDSRRAQVTIWDPAVDALPDLHDYPCTTSLQWLIRDGRLNMQVHMRSNDFWLGVPYDVFMFTQLQLAMAWVLGVEPGPYRHSAASLHVYEKHVERVEELTEPTLDALPTFGVRSPDWLSAVMTARAIHDGNDVEASWAGERWLLLALAAKRAG